MGDKRRECGSDKISQLLVVSPLVIVIATSKFAGTHVLLPRTVEGKGGETTRVSKSMISLPERQLLLE